MAEVLVVCEGQTEREFCRTVIAPYLATRGIHFAGTLAGKAFKKRPGIGTWQLYRKEMLRHAARRGRHVGVMVDYYGMPLSWPGRENAPEQAIDNRGSYVEGMLREDLPELSGRFHPCVAFHEFESLLFVDHAATALSLSIAEGCEDEKIVARRNAELVKIKDRVLGHVERINDSYQTKPSKRIEDLFTAYDKSFGGIQAALDAGLPKLRAGCPWLDRWLKSLESLGSEDDDGNVTITVQSDNT
ncbi:hypothetical protein Enr13x_41150 [Stieleria neptunia]|uniref:DUF4276 domain-containing protein n=1 Tax=Stieleria neptunia TaxID=2527979 RepID=A0A518HTT7_9BACT|nr:DUF4276 family protein [Stieleria neptunia]QDV44251.1 hypothetical protein Enr13x_41150 [Stieleria neptunia]